jgi:hypothetical protein
MSRGSETTSSGRLPIARCAAGRPDQGPPPPGTSAEGQSDGRELAPADSPVRRRIRTAHRTQPRPRSGSTETLPRECVPQSAGRLPGAGSRALNDVMSDLATLVSACIPASCKVVPDVGVQAVRKRKWQLAPMPTTAACATLEGMAGRSGPPDQRGGTASCRRVSGEEFRHGCPIRRRHRRDRSSGCPPPQPTSA